MDHLVLDKQYIQTPLMVETQQVHLTAQRLWV
jgi:hypothetical protein